MKCLMIKLSISRELLDSMQAGTLEPEVAFLNASLVWLFYICLSNLFPIHNADMLVKSHPSPFACFSFEFCPRVL